MNKAIHFSTIGELDVKLVGVVIDGGLYTLQLAHAHIKRKSPIVIVNNSGRMANILAYAYNATEGVTASDLKDRYDG